MCLPFMAQFQTGGAALAKLSERDFRQAIAIGPTPTDRCCRDAKDFTTAVRHGLLVLAMGDSLFMAEVLHGMCLDLYFPQLSPAISEGRKSKSIRGHSRQRPQVATVLRHAECQGPATHGL